MIRQTCLLLFICVAAQPVLAGDASYQETTKITGGSVMSMMKFAGAFSKDARQLNQPTVTTISVKGNRMARDSQSQTEIIDLDKETVTNIDKTKRQYSTVTFAQMRQAMQQEMEKMQTAAKEKTPPESAPAAQNTQNTNVDVSFEAHVRETGASQQISGITAKESILTLAMNGKDKTNGQQGSLAVTNDMWMAPDLPGYAEVRDFERRYAEKLNLGTGSILGPDFSKLVQQAGTSDAMKAMAKEMASLKGVPVRQIMRMGMTTNGEPLPAASEAPLPGQATPSLGSAVSQSGRMRHNKLLPRRSQTNLRALSAAISTRRSAASATSAKRNNQRLRRMRPLSQLRRRPPQLSCSSLLPKSANSLSKSTPLRSRFPPAISSSPIRPFRAATDFRGRCFGAYS